MSLSGKGIPMSLSFESPDVEKDFPGLYASQVEVEVSDDDEKHSRRRDFRGKKDKRDKKDRGYRMFEEEDSEEELFLSEDIKSPTKMKKHGKPSFKLAKKDKFKVKEKEKDHKSDREEKQKEKSWKETRKEKKEKREASSERPAKEKLRFKKSKKILTAKHPDLKVSEDVKPVFGVPLAIAVDRSKCHDSIPLPAIFRECIDYIQEFGLTCEGIYRISGVKSKIQTLKECYNRGQAVYLHDYEPNVIASLLKLYLRELPEPVLTMELMPKFEQASTIKNVKQKLEGTQNLIDELPTCNRLLLSWMIVHMTNIIAMESQNKMSLQNVSIVLSPTMQISHRVLNVLFTHSKILFRDTVIKKYIPPLRPVTSRWSLELPDSPSAIEEELRKQESVVSQIHEQLLKGKDPQKEDALWEVQRVCTQLKRKLKNARKAEEALKNAESKEKELSACKSTTAASAVKKDTKATSAKSVAHSQSGFVTKSSSEQVDSDDGRVPKQPTIVKVLRETNASAGHRRSSSNVKVEKTDILAEQHVEVATIKGHKRASSNVNVEKVDTRLDKSVDKVDIRLEKAVESKCVKETNLDDFQHVSADKKTEDPQPAEPAEKGQQSQPTATRVAIEDRTEDERVPIEEHSMAKPIKGPEPFVMITSSNKGLITETVIDGDDIVGSTAQSDAEVVDEQQSVELPNTTDRVVPTAPPAEALPIQMSGDDRRDGEDEMEKTQPDSDNLDQSTASAAIDTEVSCDSLSADCIESEEDVIDTEHYEQLTIDHMALNYEEEELLAIGDELRQKIQTEQSEIERLKQEIEELEEIHRDLYDSSSTASSVRYSSDSSDSDSTEHLEELQDIMMQLSRENAQFERDNQDLSEKIHQEQQICLEVKVQIRIIQQQQQAMQSSCTSQSAPGD